MVDMTTDRPQVPRNRLLYDSDLLGEIVDEYGNAIEIKENVKTRATVYEIRTALEYWFGGRNNHRTSDRIWDRCEAVDEGNLALDGTRVVYEADL